MDACYTFPPGSRVLYYCHDTYGLGHLRRTLTLAGYVRGAVPDVSQVIVTGSPVAHGFDLPTGTGYIKLPSVTKDDTGSYEPRSLNCSLSSVRNMRGDILLSAAHHFRPDIVVVDHAPGGFKGEVIPTLRHLKREFPATRLVLGLRDVLDEASVVRKTWLADGTHELLDDVYDQILVYGMRSTYDVVAEYGFSRRAATRTRFVG